MKFNYQSFITGLQKEFDGNFTEAEIKELLDLEDEISKDGPLSTGKRLEINYISFTGKKTTEENQEFSNEIINYSQDIYSGVNIWVADNLKGKSSIFKIIKFALTGNDSLKTNISKWIDHILVVFSINDKKYTVYINKTKSRLSAALYNKEIKVYPADGEHKDEQIFFVKNQDSFQAQLQDFFFRQFEYYSLRWTQKSSVKDSDQLLDVGASWNTYFKSIFLESKDSAELMYGGQGKKVFQMLLGLHLTAPINKLSVQKDMLMHQKGKQQSFESREVQQNAEKKSELQKSLEEITAKLNELIQAEGQTTDISLLVKRYDDLLEELNSENTKSFNINSCIQENNNANIKADSRKQYVENELSKLKKELEKAKRQERDIREYLDIGVFFSNLDLKSCPSCSHPVTPEKKQKAVTGHTCALCSDDVSQDVANISTESLSAKLQQLMQLQDALAFPIDAFKTELEELRKRSNAIYNEKILLLQQLDSIRDISSLNSELTELQGKITKERQKVRPRDTEKMELIEKKAILSFRIEQFAEVSEKVGDQRIELKITLLTRAIEELNKLRFAEGESIIKKLSDLMTKEVKALGLRISEIKISDRFDIKYKQDGDYLSFSEIAEGEQLRAKIAFYLSLIQLDIEHNYGRHSRFLIIDSPGKEEGDKNYLEGLTKLIKELEERFGDKLQILIGTAERSLANTVIHQNVFPENKYVF